METINGKQLAVERHGDGEPIIMVHGLGGTSNAWGPQADVLNQSFTVIRPDLEGSGRSPVTGPLSIAGFVADLIALMDADGIPSAHFAGHSMGTIVCQHLAVAHPDRVRSLALVGPLIAPPDDARGPIRGRAALARSNGMIPIADAIVQAATSLQTKTQRPEVAAFVRELIMCQDPEGYARSCEALADAQAADVSVLTCSVLLLTGDEDAVAPPEAVEALGAILKNAEIKIAAHCGHWTPLEQPGWVAEALATFFTGQ